jgi:TolB-like protein/DNA-binding SARP family transcriptional activator
MITLHVLGTPDLRRPDGRHLASPAAGAKRIGLLAYLALAPGRGPSRRDTLLGLFWPESDQRSARNALSNMLHQVRRSLGDDALITSGRDAVGLAPDGLWCDAVAFEAFLNEGRLPEALELYRGDLLEGLFIPVGSSSAFESWLDGERARLRGRASDAARALYEGAEAEGRKAEALRWARWAVGLDPYDERSARRLMTLLAEAGDRAGALRTYKELAGRLAREFEAEPDPETGALIREIRSYGGRGSASHARWPAAAPPHGEDRAGSMLAATRTGPLPIRWIAVLPFENLSGSADADPFVTGLHDDLLTELSRIAALSVIARTSVLRYRGTTRPVPEIARELGVGTIIEGGVQTADGRLRLNVQVIDAVTGAHRWAERYDRELSAVSIFDLQGDLSREIAGALETELTSSERRRAGRGGRERTEDLEAYRLCVQGRTLLDQRTPRAMVRSVEYFQRVIQRDAGYALAWSGLADALSLLEFYDHTAPAGAPDPMEAALRAVVLGPELGQARASLGIVRGVRHQGAAALVELEQATELAPSHAEAHAWLGWIRLLQGHARRALTALSRAVELDPLAPAFRAYRAEAHLAAASITSAVNASAAGAGELAADALREAVRTRQLQPEYGLAHFVEGLVLYHLGRAEEGEAALETSLGLVPPWGVPRHAEVHAAIAVIRAAAGDSAGARARLARIDGQAHPFSRGLVLAALGELDEAMTAFESVRNWDSFSVDHYRYFFPRELGALRAEPRFVRLRDVIDRIWCIA